MNTNLNSKWDIELSFDVPEDYFMALDFSLKKDKKITISSENSNDKHQEFNSNNNVLF